MSGTLDVVLADKDNFTSYGSQGFFTDLSNVMNQDDLAQYSGKLIYLDLPNDEKNEEVPIGIHITSAPKVISTDCYADGDAYFGIVSGSHHENTAISFLSYLFQ